MRGFGFRFFWSTIVVVLTAGSLQAEVIRMTDGTLHQGQIIGESRFIITIRLPDGQIKRLLRKDVANIMSDEAWKETQQKAAAPQPASGTASEPVTAATAVTEEQRALILRLMQVSGTQQALLSLYESLLKKASPQDQETIRRRFNVYELMERLIPIYAKIYQEDELRELIQFYSSPLGQKMLKNSPAVLEQSFQQTLTYLMSLLKPETSQPESQNHEAHSSSQ